MLMRRIINSFKGDDEVTRLKSRVARLERENNRMRSDLVSRRSDDILATRGELLPMPRPGSSGARLLARNRALQRRVQSLIGERAAVAQELLDAANDAAAAGRPQLARALRGRASALADAAQGTPLEVETIDSSTFDVGAITVVRSWRDLDAARWVGLFWSRVRALDATIGPAPHALALRVQGVSDALALGPRGVAEVIADACPKLTEDRFAVGAESVLYAMAVSLGTRWNEEVRSAWCSCIDAVSRSLGFGGMSGAVLFSTDESSGESRL